MRNILNLVPLLILTACAIAPPEPDEVPVESAPELRLVPSSYAQLPGWGEDELVDVLPALERTCVRLEKKPADQPVGLLPEAGTMGDWQAICRDLLATPVEQLASRIQHHLQPWQVMADNEATGLFTGYYEPSLNGSRTRVGPYRTPLHARPDDLVMVDLGEFRESMKGERIAGRVQDGRLRPYESRAEIVAGDWPHDDQVLVWVDDPVDAFFVQIQGSGVVQLNDGETMRIGYAGQNGHPYFAIGRALIEQGELTRETVSLQTIRAWLDEHPDQAVELMNRNPSYVFFRPIEGEGPVGAEGVALTAGRSLAVDRTLIPFGIPVWLTAAAPSDRHPPIRRLVMAQDTGGASRGPVRGDLFWGFGPEAEYHAGNMKSEGRYWLLLPRTSSH